MTPWDLVSPFIEQFSPSPVPTAPSQDSISEWFKSNLSALTGPLTTITPKTKPSTWSKAWWNPNLSMLRQIHHSLARAAKKGTATAGQAKSAKYAFFNAIKKAKFEHWNSFIASSDTKDLWAVARLRKPKQQDRLPSFPNAKNPTELNQALISHFFPPRPATLPPPCHKDPACPPISIAEVSKALAKSSNKSTPGPDQIPYGVWKRIHSINPSIIPQLLTPLAQHGVHPDSLKNANGIVLPKPNKPSYADPSAYRIIVLLETFSKILERIMTFRLFDHASKSALINPHQCGSLPGLSVDDAALSLIHDVRTLQHSGFKVSTLFLDIKGGFDNVRSSILTNRLRAHRTPTYLTNWVASFLNNRTCRLLYKGSPMLHIPVDVGVPQGSPISPLLFVIYVAPLHLTIPRGITYSYVDDFALTTASPSYRSNVRKLQQTWDRLQHTAAELELSFSIAKTDFIHWRTERDRSPPPIHPFASTISFFSRSKLSSGSASGSTIIFPLTPIFNIALPKLVICSFSFAHCLHQGKVSPPSIIGDSPKLFCCQYYSTGPQRSPQKTPPSGT